MTSVVLSLTFLIFAEAEQSLNKSEKVAGDRAKVSSISDDDIDEWDMKIYMALAK